ncbi:hypothetical protein DFQ27_003228 [Actinomortierella ambigua]|uniref:Uncharacterized protein n=1 Tax=Actinomortierella ambigua TaxID=1343610 RepID=A0A9P6Q598_9FUNG|nr:hypothetical protein DFQ27_003228 [Actinomortierella ambigua]
MFTLSLKLEVSRNGMVSLPSEQIAHLNVANIEVDSDYMTADAVDLLMQFGAITIREFEGFFTFTKGNVLVQWLYPI